MRTDDSHGALTLWCSTTNNPYLHRSGEKSTLLKSSRREEVVPREALNLHSISQPSPMTLFFLFTWSGHLTKLLHILDMNAASFMDTIVCIGGHSGCTTRTVLEKSLRTKWSRSSAWCTPFRWVASPLSKKNSIGRNICVVIFIAQGCTEGDGKAQAKKVFAALDIDKDGKIGLEEFITVGQTNEYAN